MLLKIVTKVNDILDKFCFVVLAAMMGAMLLICVSQVVGREIIKWIPSWMEEMCRYLLIWTSYLGAAALLRKGGHTSVSVLVNLFPFQFRRSVAVIVDLLMTVFYGILGYYGALLMQRYAYRMAETMSFSLAFLYVVFPLTFFMMMLFSMEEILLLLMRPERVARIQKERIDDADMLLENEDKKASGYAGEEDRGDMKTGGAG